MDNEINTVVQLTCKIESVCEICTHPACENCKDADKLEIDLNCGKVKVFGLKKV